VDKSCRGLSDCEELVGVTYRRWWGPNSSFRYIPTTFSNLL